MKVNSPYSLSGPTLSQVLHRMTCSLSLSSLKPYFLSTPNRIHKEAGVSTPKARARGLVFLQPALAFLQEATRPHPWCVGGGGGLALSLGGKPQHSWRADSCPLGAFLGKILIQALLLILELRVTSLLPYPWLPSNFLPSSMGLMYLPCLFLWPLPTVSSLQFSLPVKAISLSTLDAPSLGPFSGTLLSLLVLVP